MTYKKLKQMADAMSAAEVNDSLVSLVNDPRFAAVVRILDDHREQYIQAGTAQGMATHHGVLAHNAGSVYALNTFTGVIKQLCEPPKKRGQQKPVET
jgi:hypothetical protein